MSAVLASTNSSDQIHFRLKNWGAFQRANANVGPAENPEPASWQEQITETDRWPPEPPVEHYIDNEDAVKVQKAVVLCMENDRITAMALIRHYHYRTFTAPKLVHMALSKFWRYLFF